MPRFKSHKRASAQRAERDVDALGDQLLAARAERDEALAKVEQLKKALRRLLKEGTTSFTALDLARAALEDDPHKKT